MDKTIIKIVLSGAGPLDYWLPEGAEFLGCHKQNSTVCLWFLTSKRSAGRTEPDLRIRTFSYYLTGQSIPPGNRKFLGTLLFNQDSIAIHVFEELEGL